MNWLIIGAIIVGLLVLIYKTKNMKGAFYFTLLIGVLIAFTISLNYIISTRNIDLASYDGITEVGRIYLSWLGNLFSNVGKTAGYVVKQDWAINVSSNATAIK